MFCVFPSDASDFSGNGLGAVAPTTCIVTETLNGEWELQLTHPLDDEGKWARFVGGNTLRAPVPIAPISIEHMATLKLGLIASLRRFFRVGSYQKLRRNDDRVHIGDLFDLMK